METPSVGYKAFFRSLYQAQSLSAFQPLSLNQPLAEPSDGTGLLLILNIIDEKDGQVLYSGIVDNRILGRPVGRSRITYFPEDFQFYRTCRRRLLCFRTDTWQSCILIDGLHPYEIVATSGGFWFRMNFPAAVVVDRDGRRTGRSRYGYSIEVNLHNPNPENLNPATVLYNSPHIWSESPVV